MYKLEDLKGENVEGKFYPWELRKLMDVDSESSPAEMVEIKRECITLDGLPDLTSGFQKRT